jgi:hypothetical protein
MVYKRQFVPVLVWSAQGCPGPLRLHLTTTWGKIMFAWLVGSLDRRCSRGDWRCRVYWRCLKISSSERGRGSMWFNFAFWFLWCTYASFGQATHLMFLLINDIKFSLIHPFIRVESSLTSGQQLYVEFIRPPTFNQAHYCCSLGFLHCPFPPTYRISSATSCLSLPYSYSELALFAHCSSS